VTKESNLRKKTVELEGAARPSRIRREPPPRPDNALARKLDRIDWGSPEWEVRLAVGWILFFALALVAVVIDIGHFLSW